MLISVIVPVLNEAGYILESLASARSGCSHAEVELIVVDGGSTDGTPRLIPGDARLLAAPRGRAVQLNCGARASRGEALLFLHADWRLMSGDQAQFARREAFFRVGGFPEIPLMEDLELARQLGRVGRLARLPLPGGRLLAPDLAQPQPGIPLPVLRAGPPGPGPFLPFQPRARLTPPPIFL